MGASGHVTTRKPLCGAAPGYRSKISTSAVVKGSGMAGITPEVAERVYAATISGYGTGAPAAVRGALGIGETRFGGGVALAVRADPSRCWSLAAGFGFTEPVTAGLVGRITDFYRAAGVTSATLQLAPSVLPADWPALAEAAGRVRQPPWVKIGAAAEEVAAPRPATDLVIRRILGDELGRWADVVLAGSGLPAGLQGMITGAMVRPGVAAYAAFDGTELVATGGLRVHEDVAHFFSGATLPHARRRGAQSALLAERARAAVAAGCRLLVGETTGEGPGEHNSSLRNVLRAGFGKLYEVQNWLWRPGYLGVRTSGSPARSLG
ncbi:hypothetical protein [Amycolatopsis sp. NPDC051903]|uniref:hypothetical protein n=1 Tax=Amycolatopsis sp. NPDC051903 TaxID=3363936 RepID=UPI00379EB888